jgi:dolichol-phosphate mannosyltransferase
MDSKFSKLIVVIPTYNEKDNIAKLIGMIFNLYPQSSVLVVDDDSPDGTAQAVKEAQTDFANLHLLERRQDRGFARSYMDGFKNILADNRYDYVVMMDADFSHNPQVVRAMVNQLDKYPVVIGSRYVAGGRIENWNWKRRLLSRFANLYVRTILAMPVRDMTTGFMCFRKEVLNKIDPDALNSDGYAFLVEFKYRLVSAGFDAHEQPIIFRERREGQSKMSSKVIWESIWLPWKLKIEYFYCHSFVRDFATLQAGNIFGNVAQALAGILMARILQPKLFGVYALAFSLAGFMSIFLGVGAQDAVTTIVGEAYAKKDHEKTHEALAFLAKITLIMGAIALIGALFAPLIAKGLYKNYMIGVYAMVVVFASIISTTFFSFSMIGLQVVNKIKAMTLLGLTDQLSRVLLALAFVIFGFGVAGIVSGHFIGASAVFIISVIIWRNLTKKFMAFPPIRSLWRHLKTVSLKKYFGFSFLIAMDRNLSNLYNIFPVLLTGIYISTTGVTFFKLAFGYMNLALSFLGPIGTLLNVEFPKMKVDNIQRLSKNFVRISLYGLGLSALLTLGAAIVSPLAFGILYGPNFAPSVKYVYGLIPYGAFLGIGIGLGSILRALNKVKFSIILHIFNLGIGVPLALLLIKYFGAWGTVAVVTAWYTIAHFVTFFYVRGLLKKVSQENYVIINEK